jgi:pimeloyl-ACP methyl ester carboxylesterase
MATRILLLTGMTPDQRIFDRLLPQLSNAEIIPWITPKDREALGDYVDRLAGTLTIQPNEPVVVCGASFGGIVAMELATRLNTKSCVLISSVRSPSELPRWQKICRPLMRVQQGVFLKWVGTFASACPRSVRTAATLRLAKLGGDEGSWYRWATNSVLNWRCDAEPVPTIQIHGDRDTTFPLRFNHPDVIIEGGGHMLPLTHATQIAEVITRLAA